MFARPNETRGYVGKSFANETMNQNLKKYDYHFIRKRCFFPDRKSYVGVVNAAYVSNEQAFTKNLDNRPSGSCYFSIIPVKSISSHSIIL